MCKHNFNGTEFKYCPMCGVSFDIEFAELRAVAQPLIDYINSNYDSHTTAIVQGNFVRIVRDEIGFPIKD